MERQLGAAHSTLPPTADQHAALCHGVVYVIELCGVDVSDSGAVFWCRVVGSDTSSIGDDIAMYIL